MSHGLGDTIEDALNVIGITSERIERWLGVECNCEERKEKLNRLSRWANRIVKGKVEKAEHYLKELLGS